MHTVLVLGGYGFFGGRICTALAVDAGIRLLVGGRDAVKARALCATLGLPETQGLAVDARDAQLAEQLARLGVNTLIHTAGPFQAQDYAVARAAISAGCHYLDLADARHFVAGIAVLDALARERGVTVVSGASSLPALSSAVIDACAKEFSRLDHIRTGIGSGARSPGIATVRGVFSYCGKSFPRWENSAWVPAHGWMDMQRHCFPEPLGPRWLGSCDVPDLELFPVRYPGVATVSFHAGFASDLGHLVVWALSGLVRARLLPSLRIFARPLNIISQWIEPLVSDKGGMFVTLDGLDRADQPLSRTWNLIASQNHGPQIPCGASIALARKLARGDELPRGAMPCMGLLSVEEYLAPLRHLDIREFLT